jgi:hypothetical protein
MVCARENEWAPFVVQEVTERLEALNHLAFKDMPAR